MMHSSSEFVRAYFPQKFAKQPKHDGCPTHIDAAVAAALHIEHDSEPERYAAHGCYRRLY